MATPIPSNDAPFTVFGVRAACAGRVLHLVNEERVCAGITTDSRAIKAGSIFVALRGERFDGHTYLEQAVAAGAGILVVERGRADAIKDRIESASIVEVEDTLIALGDLGRCHLQQWRANREKVHASAPIVVITGSAGKTTTKEFVAALLELVGPVLRTSGNLNNLIGLPSTALCLKSEHTAAVLEAGMSVPGEIARLAQIAQPSVALVSNIGLAHAGGVGGTRGDVAREKGALYAALGPTGIAIGNGDDTAIGGELLRARGARTHLFGRNSACDVRLVRRTVLREGVALRGHFVFALHGASEIELTVPHFSEVHGLAMAAALCTYRAIYGDASLDIGSVERAFSRVTFEGRFDVKAFGDDCWLVDDTYNANPQSMAASLHALRELGAELSAEPSQPRRLVAVLGEMRELGARSERDHRELGALVHAAGVSLLIGCGGDATFIGDEAAKRGVEVHQTDSAEHARTLALALVRAKDIILVKASRGVQAEVVVQSLLARSLG